ncbi:hypothetical protein [Nonomuraea rubra]|uniref:hypothetical protein n=1 Tax=Nonomuraea rubra TaxID=46180 RepID=UPI0031E8BEB5
MLNALLDLVLPPACAGCGAKGASCCPRCFQALTAEPARRSPVPRPDDLTVYLKTARRRGGAVTSGAIAQDDRGGSRSGLRHVGSRTPTARGGRCPRTGDAYTVLVAPWGRREWAGATAGSPCGSA